MNIDENIFLTIHQLYPNDVCNSIQLEIDPEDQIVSNVPLNMSEKNLEKNLKWHYAEDESKFNLKHLIFPEEDPTVTLIKIGGQDDLSSINMETNISKTINLKTGTSNYIFEPSSKHKKNHLNLPDATVISCQNCDTTFPTKYQYQRHQCEFNAEKVVLKPEIIGKDIDKATRLRFECDTCKKTFVSNNNLERHKSCHTNNNKTNVCEFCKKAFVSENRLKIHKENHCKKAGDMTKFYRSDVVVWHCENCKQVFATQQCGNKHIQDCAVIVRETIKPDDKSENVNIKDENVNIKNVSIATTQNNNFDANFEMAIQTQSEDSTIKEIPVVKLSKVVTEILYQCEFCNQTYITKSTLLEHQSTHTTEKNYECTFCDKYFNSFMVATSHWQNKCTEESNLFYLPKMVYCEHCDRGFKSHEILYSHKNKKKHFTPKIHENKISRDNDARNENAIVKLIESMITKMDKKAFVQNEDNSEDSDIKVKTEDKENEAENGKKKRGRKRKWHKVELKAKKKGDMLIEGYMYQCERCSVVFKDVASLDAHKNTQHVSIYSCGQCGQVLNPSHVLMKVVRLDILYVQI